MMKATTFVGPSASVASVATRLESTPPLRPMTTRSKPTLRTSLRMKPTRIPRTSSGLIRNGGKTGSERLAGALIPDPVAVEEKGREELGVGAAEEAVRLRCSEALVGRDPTAGARGRTDDHVHPFQAQDVGTGEVPDVLADQDPCPAESSLETAEAVPRGEVASLVEHAVGREVHLAVHVNQFAAAEVEAGVEVAMIRLFDHRAEDDVQLSRQAAQLVHHSTLQRDRGFRHQVFEEVAGQAELGEDQQLHARLARLAHPLAMALEVAGAVAEGRVHLHQPDREPAVLAHALRCGIPAVLTSVL